MADAGKVSVSKEVLTRLLENQKKLAEKVEREKEKREQAEDRKRWWAKARVAASQTARKVVGHWGTIAVVGGMALSSGAAALGLQYYISEPLLLLLVGLLGKATAAVGAAGVSRTLLSDFLEGQEKEDAKLLPEKIEVVADEPEKEVEIDFVYEDEVED